MSEYYDLEMTGPELSERLGKVLENEQAIADETTRAEGVEALKANADDVYTKQQTDDAIDAEVLIEKERAEGVEATKANADDVYTKQQTDDAINVEKERAEGVEATKANAADVYNKSEVYTKHQTDEAIAAEAALRQAGDENLQEQLDDILDGSSGLTLNTAPELVQVGVASDVMLTARTTVPAQSIVIKREDTIVTSGSGNRLDGVDRVTANAEGVINYKAFFEIGDAKGDVTKVVHSVLPIFYGAGATYSEAQHQAPLRLSPAGVYNITVATTGQYLFFIVPWSMKIDLVLMNGYEVPFDEPVEDDVYMGFAYKMYKSSNAYDAGTYEIVVIK